VCTFYITSSIVKKIRLKGEKPWLRQMAHDQEVVGSNPSTVYWMNVSDLLAITLKKNWKIKVAKWGTPRKYLKKLKRK
jgi:hypothetical protein